MKSRTTACVLATALMLTLAGCSAEPHRGPRLADAKSIVQLVRNEAGERIPAESVAEVSVLSDGSEECVGQDDDSAGTQRRWVATSLITFTADAGDTLEATYADLINSFSANGWSEVSYGGGGSVTLNKPESQESIAFLATAADDAAGEPASITMSIVSGCVETVGDESAVLEDAAR